MSLMRINETVYGSPWLITQEGWLSIHRVLSQRELRLDAEGLKSEGVDLSCLVNSRPGAIVDSNGVGHAWVEGPMGIKTTPIQRSCGVTDMGMLGRELIELSEVEGARAIVLHVSSPGGTLTGTPELADIVASLGIPVLAYTDDLMASAAYYVSAGANYIWASRSAPVGSIGVIIPWADESKAWEQAGVQFVNITNEEADLKGITPRISLTDAQRDFLQDQVQQAFNDFAAHVRKFRSVPDSAMRGQVLSGRQALEANLVDRLGSFEQAYNFLLTKIKD